VDFNIIFLISQPRSGSTLTQKLLGAHSKIYTRSEPWLMLHPLYALKTEGIKTNYNVKTAKIALESFIADLPEAEKTYQYEMGKMYRNLYRYYLKDTNSNYFLDKTPRYYLIVDELLELFPQAKYILLIRNPMAVLGSIIKTWTKENWIRLSNSKDDLLTVIDIHIDILEKRSDHFFIFHYEELLENEENVLQRIFEYLALDYEKGVLDFEQHKNEKWRYGDPINVYEKKYIDKANDKKWIEGLDDPQYWRVMNDYLKYIGKERMIKLGYDYDILEKILLDNQSFSTISEIEKKTISLFELLESTEEKKDKLARETQLEIESLKEKNIFLMKSIDDIKTSKKYHLTQILAKPFEWFKQ